VSRERAGIRRPHDHLGTVTADQLGRCLRWASQPGAVYPTTWTELLAGALWRHPERIRSSHVALVRMMDVVAGRNVAGAAVAFPRLRVAPRVRLQHERPRPGRRTPSWCTNVKVHEKEVGMVHEQRSREIRHVAGRYADVTFRQREELFSIGNVFAISYARVSGAPRYLIPRESDAAGERVVAAARAPHDRTASPRRSSRVPGRLTSSV
jgi:hypothetical protein